MTDPLTKLAISYGTDKFGYHDYTPNYYKLFKHLRKKPLRLLEIGVGGYQDADRGGESLEVWRDFFPEGQIIGIDIQKKEMDLGPRVKILQGSQVDPEFLEMLVRDHGPFDIIIDDGSHQNLHVVTSFDLLYPTLAPGGIYVAEDVQTAFFPRFGGSIELSEPNSVGYLGAIFRDLETRDDIAAMERFHNMIAMKKPDEAGTYGAGDMLEHLKGSDLRVLELGASTGDDPFKAFGRKLAKVERVQLDKVPTKKAAKALVDKGGEFDVVLDHGTGDKTRQTVEAMFGLLKMGGTYLVAARDGAGADWLHDLFVQVDHREIVVNFPGAEIGPLAREIYAMERVDGIWALQKAPNDYPSNFGFDFKHPQARMVFDVMENVLDASGQERGLLLFSDIMTRAGEEDRAAKMLNRLGDMKANSRVFYNMAVRQKKKADKWDEALALLRDAVARYPEDYRIRSQLGASLMKAREFAEAEEHFNKGIELAPRDPLLRIQLANALSQLGRADEAVAAAEMATTLAPEHAGHRMQLGRLQLVAGAAEPAIETLTLAITLNPEMAPAHRHMSRALSLQARRDEAISAAERALELAPGNPEYTRWLDSLKAA